MGPVGVVNDSGGGGGGRLRQIYFLVWGDVLKQNALVEVKRSRITHYYCRLQKHAPLS
jgi:hypothetical protein